MKRVFKRVLRIVLYVLAGVVVLLVLATAGIGTYLALTFKPADYQRMLADAVEQRTHRKLVISGDLGLKFFPCCSVVLGQTEFGNPPGFPADPFVRVHKAELSLRLWPLLTRREVEIGTVALDGLEANLIEHKDGATNWDFESPAPAAAPDSNAPASSVTSLQVGGIKIHDARIAYRSDKSGANYLVENIEVRSSQIRPGKPFDFSLALRLTNVVSLLAANLKLTSGGTLDPDGRHISLTKTGVDVTASGGGLPGKGFKGKFGVGELAVDLGDTTSVAVHELTSEFELADLGGTLSVTGDGEYSDKGAKMAGHLKLAPVSPRAVLALLSKPSPVTADPQALTRLAGAADWSLEPDAIALSQMDIQLDRTHLLGSVRVAGFDHPATSFDLRLDAMDLDAYGAPESKSTGKPADAEKKASPPTKIPTETIRDLRLDGKVQIGQLTVSKAKLSGIAAGVRAKDGRLHVDPISAHAYGGTLQGRLVVDVSGSQPRVTLDQQVTGLAVGDALRDLYKNDKLEGALNVKFDATGSGHTDDDVLKTLAGTVSMSLANGAFKGLDIGYEINQARALVKGLGSAAPRPERPMTRIIALETTGTIGNSVLHTDKLVAQIPLIRLTGKGDLGLLDKTLDYALLAQFFQSQKVSDKESAAPGIPLTLKGTTDAPKVSVNFKGLAQTVVPDTVRENIKEKQQTIKDKVFKRFGL